MSVGTIKKLVHLSTQTHLDSAQLVRDHNDTGFGMIQADSGDEVYFGFDVVEGCRFEELWEGQDVSYELDGGFEHRAKLVSPVNDDAEMHKSGLKNPEPPPIDDE